MSHGTRTLAPVVSHAPRGRQRLLPEVRLVPALGPGRSLPVSRPALPGGKPPPAGGVSKGSDARPERGAGGKGRGSKLHTQWASRAPAEACEGRPLNEAEAAAARRRPGPAPGAGYAPGDGNHDASPASGAAAAASGSRRRPTPAPAGGITARARTACGA